MPVKTLAGQAVVELLLRDRMTQGLHKAGAKLKAFGRMVDTVAMGMMKAGALMAIPTAVAGKTFMAFEKQMVQVSTMLDKPEKHMDRFNASIRKMSKEFGVGTDELAAGLYQILSATIPAENAIEVLEASTKAAIGGITDVGTATKAIVGIMNAYGMEASSAAEVSDTLFMTVKRGQLTYEELANSIGTATAFAKQAGIPIEQLGATLALVTTNNIAADKAINGLRQGLSSMMKPASEADKIFQSLFGETFDISAIQKAGDFIQFLKEIKVRTDALQTGPRENALVRLFGDIRAGQALLGVVDNVDKLTTNMDYMANKAGIADKQFQKFNETVGKEFDRLIQSAKDLFLEMGMGLRHVMKQWMESLRETIEGITDFVSENHLLIQSFVKLTGLMLAGGVALKTFSFLLGIVTPLVVKLGSVLIKSLQFGLIGATKGVMALLAALSPILPVLVGVQVGMMAMNQAFDLGLTLTQQLAGGIAIVVAGFAIYKTVLLTISAVMAIWNSLTVAATAANAVLEATILVLASTIGGLYLGAILAFAAAFTYSFTEAGKSFDQFGKRTNSVFGEIHEAGTDAYHGIVAAWQAGSMERVAKIAITALHLIWTKFWNWLKEGFTASWDSIANLAKDFVGFLAVLLIKPGQWLFQGFLSVGNAISNFFSWVAQTIEGTFMMITSLIAGTLHFITGGLIGMSSKEIDNWAREIGDKYEKERAEMNKKHSKLQQDIEDKTNEQISGLFDHHDTSAQARRDQIMGHRREEDAIKKKLKFLRTEAHLYAFLKEAKRHLDDDPLVGLGDDGAANMDKFYEALEGQGFRENVEAMKMPEIEIPDLQQIDNIAPNFADGMTGAMDAIKIGMQGAFGAASNISNIRDIFGRGAVTYESRVLDKLTSINNFMKQTARSTQATNRNLTWQ